MGYEKNSEIVRSGLTTLPSEDDLVTTYFGGSNRDLGVIGASQTSNETYYTVVLSLEENGHVKGASMYGDSYLAGTSITVVAHADEGYALKNWVIKGEENGFIKAVSYTFTVNTDTVVTPTFSTGYALVYDANGAEGDVPETVLYAEEYEFILASGNGLYKFGYDFNSWTLDPDGTGESFYPGIVISMDDYSVTLYAKWTMKENISRVCSLIDKIGLVENDIESRIKINSARAAYDALTTEEKTIVENYTLLAAAENVYDTYVVNDAIVAINTIGEVSFTDESKALIDDARDAYAALTTSQKALVSNYETLTSAERSYNLLLSEAKVSEVIAKINAIGTVTSTDESNALIMDARDAYNALTAEQQAAVTNYAALTSAEVEYANLTEKSSLGAGKIAIIVISVLVVLGAAGYMVFAAISRKKKIAISGKSE